MINDDKVEISETEYALYMKIKEEFDGRMKEMTESLVLSEQYIR